VVAITDCDQENGTCICKANVDNEVNSVCDTCQDGFWNISTENPDGCQGMYNVHWRKGCFSQPNTKENIQSGRARLQKESQF